MLTTLKLMRMMIAILSLSFVACAGSPTEPGAPESTPSTVAVPPAPAPGPTPTPPVPPPSPTPEPPTPAPPPAPVPTPTPPQNPNTWQAEMTGGHWFLTPALPSSFTVSWDLHSLTFGPLTGTIIAADARTVFAHIPGTNAVNGAKVLIEYSSAERAGTWTYDGPSGLVWGTLSRSSAR